MIFKTTRKFNPVMKYSKMFIVTLFLITLSISCKKEETDDHPPVAREIARDRRHRRRGSHRRGRLEDHRRSADPINTNYHKGN